MADYLFYRYDDCGMGRLFSSQSDGVVLMYL